MAIDWKAERVCDHRVSSEKAALDSDLQTIRLPRALASSTILLRVNGIKVPQTHPNWGYMVADDELSVAPAKKRKILIKRPSRAQDDLIEITYYTFSNQCPKCQGLKVHNDIEWDAIGKPILLQKSLKLEQEVKKGIVTELGSNPFHSWIGTRIIDRIGSKVVSISQVRLALMDEITSFISNFQNVQKKQIESGQEVLSAEVFLRLVELRVEPVDPRVPSVFNVVISYQNAAGDISSTQVQLALPTGGLLDDNNVVKKVT